MLSRQILPRTLRSTIKRTSNLTRSITTARPITPHIQSPPQQLRLPSHTPSNQRTLLQTRRASTDTSTPSPTPPPKNTPAGDAAVDQLTELFATAFDEFEIASESTEANATYAEEDRKAAREELDGLLKAFNSVDAGEGKEVGDEVRRRIGQRIRELEQGVKAMEEKALEHD